MSNEELVQQIQLGINKSDNMTILYTQNKGFIAKVVKRYSSVCRVKNSHEGVGIIEFDELMNEAYFGLAEAVNRYDSGQGTLFLTYAAIWIRQVVKRYLDNCGQLIRVPVHKQQQVYEYNQVSAYFFRTYNRSASREEFAIWLNVSEKTIDELEQFMFRKNVKSLDEPIPGGNDEDNTLSNIVPDALNIESDVINQIAIKQIQSELWNIVNEVLNHDKMVTTILYRFKEGLTLDETGKRMGITRELVRQYESKGLRRLRCNSRTKRLIEDYLIA